MLSFVASATSSIFSVAGYTATDAIIGSTPSGCVPPGSMPAPWSGKTFGIWLTAIPATTRHKQAAIAPHLIQMGFLLFFL